VTYFVGSDGIIFFKNNDDVIKVYPADPEDNDVIQSSSIYEVLEKKPKKKS
jgi:hypothetical protein